ncbi:MAG TPA: VWA domain-containing protein [Methylomusa anaerophila]|uniref:Magnesium-chelatase 38 kDa subunit n=1 Tax=Methylomusa anaerophila TaxID=1930071 RepID=A0A348AM66_9FIRM|nr:VWA domain-containing protein [Methylomusa anaerophila]BBB92164.1 magnesium-chelatase 38 kDa subunit [Methylomusa anaerophila]HML87822.1 VWA domain-containing protein [Methylomusa anaerophila]
MAHRVLFPFAAVVGQDEVKRALLIAMVNPKAGGVLVAGEKGAAKSTLVRGLADIIPADTWLVELPLNATEDMVFGSLDMEYAVVNGQRRFCPGILAKAHGNVLYIDEINLLRRDLVTAILDTAASGVNVVEREGISYRHEAVYTIIGTMNPEEGTLPPAVLDRFGLYAAVNREKDAGARALIVRRILAYDREPDIFMAQYREETKTIMGHVAAARGKIKNLEVADAMIQLAAQMCAQARSAGHRAELYLLEAAKAIAALAGREYLLPADVEEAARFVLPHRVRQEEQPPADSRQQSGGQQDRERQPPPPPEQQPNEGEDQPPPAGDDQQPDEPADGQQEQQAVNDAEAKEQTADIDRTFPLTNVVVSLPQDRQVRRGNGKRNLTRTDTRQGRYVRAGLPCGPVTDLAFDATLRAAAPYQRSRGKGRCCITVQREDLRQKVREKRIGNTFLFVVDASGSMGARERMRAVKGAIFAMLQDAYQKRDQVGLIAFRRQTAEVLLPVTRSVDLAQKCLQHLPTGGKTPLAEGLSTALNVLKAMQKKEKEMQPILVLVTDGRANIGDNSNNDAVAAALKTAGKIGINGFHSVVIDTEADFVRLGVARAVAREMGSIYYSLQELSDENIMRIVKSVH